MAEPSSASWLLARLEGFIATKASAVVAYSGGVDSALVAFVASRRIRTLATMADSPSVPRSEIESARHFAKTHSILFRLVATNENEQEGYVSNAGQRCYFCKHTLHAALAKIAREESYEVVMDGTNLSDLGDERPGLRAGVEHGVVSPLVEAGLDKAAVRALSLHLGLPTWDKPSSPCLASRIPIGRRVTLEALDMIERAEEILKGAGFRVVRVRYLGERALVELGEGERDETRFNGLIPDLRNIGFAAIELSSRPYVEPHLRSVPG